MISLHALPSALTRSQIVAATNQDEHLMNVRKWLSGSPIHLGPYETVKLDLSQTSDGLVLRGNRICIPASLEDMIIMLAHLGHQGIVRTKQLIRNHVWFPGIDSAVESAVQKCRECQVNTDKVQLQPLQMSPMPCGPWAELSIDFYGPLKNGKYLLVLVDDYSRYPIVKLINSTGASSVIPLLTDIFSTFGVPDTMRSDNGPPFNGMPFKQFAKDQGFRHRRITPLWPRANGIAERFMRNLGKLVKNSSSSGSKLESELVSFLRNYRATPHASTKTTPHQLLFKTKSSTSKLPVLRQKQVTFESSSALFNDAKAKEKMKQYSDNKHKATHSSLRVGDKVYLKLPQTLGKASSVYDPEPYAITSIKGTQAIVVRNNQQLRRNLALLKKAAPVSTPTNATSTTPSRHKSADQRLRTSIRPALESNATAVPVETPRSAEEEVLVEQIIEATTEEIVAEQLEKMIETAADTVAQMSAAEEADDSFEQDREVSSSPSEARELFMDAESDGEVYEQDAYPTLMLTPGNRPKRIRKQPEWFSKSAYSA